MKGKRATRPPWQKSADELCSRFALTGHQWRPANAAVNPSDVIRRDGQAVLVRIEPNVSATPRRLTIEACGAIQCGLFQASMAVEMDAQGVIPNPDPLRPFACEARWMCFGDLLARAREGDKLAIKEAAVMAVEITKVLTDLRGNTRTLPAIEAVAGDMFEWPTLLGASKEFSENREDVVKKIGLGGRRIPNTGGRASWINDDRTHSE